MIVKNKLTNTNNIIMLTKKKYSYDINNELK